MVSLRSFFHRIAHRHRRTAITRRLHMKCQVFVVCVGTTRRLNAIRRWQGFGKRRIWVIFYPSSHPSMHCVSSAINHEFINITSLKVSPREWVRVRAEGGASACVSLVESVMSLPLHKSHLVVNVTATKMRTYVFPATSEWQMGNNVCNV